MTEKDARRRLAQLVTRASVELVEVVSGLAAGRGLDDSRVHAVAIATSLDRDLDGPDRSGDVARKAAHLESMAGDRLDLGRVAGDMGRVVRAAHTVFRPDDSRRTECERLLVRVAELFGTPFPGG